MVEIIRYLFASLLFLLSHHPAGATPAASDEVSVHVQVLKNGTVTKDVTLTAKQGDTATACFGKKHDNAVATAAQPPIDCEGLQVAFSPKDLGPELIRASFAIEYRVQSNTTPETVEGFSLGGNFPMTPGTPIITSDGPYMLRVYARY